MVDLRALSWSRVSNRYYRVAPDCAQSAACGCNCSMPSHTVAAGRTAVGRRLPLRRKQSHLYAGAVRLDARARSSSSSRPPRVAPGGRRPANPAGRHQVQGQRSGNTGGGVGRCTSLSRGCRRRGRRSARCRGRAGTAPSGPRPRVRRSPHLPGWQRSRAGDLGCKSGPAPRRSPLTLPYFCIIAAVAENRRLVVAALPHRLRPVHGRRRPSAEERERDHEPSWRTAATRVGSRAGGPAAANGAVVEFHSPWRPLGRWLEHGVALPAADRSGLAARKWWPVCYGGTFAAMRRLHPRAAHATWAALGISRCGDNIEEGHFVERMWGALLTSDTAPVEPPRCLPPPPHAHRRAPRPRLLLFVAPHRRRELPQRQPRRPSLPRRRDAAAEPGRVMVFCVSLRYLYRALRRGRRPGPPRG